jgi:hypothetical protein
MTMSKTSAQDYYNQQAGDPDDGYITPDDAKASVGMIYDDMAAADALAAKAATIGNLLTANQASGGDTLGNTTGFSVLNECTLARTTDWAASGSGSLAMTATATVTMTAGTTGNTGGIAQGGVAVTPGDVITAVMTVRLKAGVSRTGFPQIYFYGSGGAYSSNADGTAKTLSDSSNTVLTITATVPAGAAFAGAVVTFGTGSIGDVCYADNWGLWKGTGGQWAMPGTPITGTGYRVRAGGLVDVWDGTQWLNIGTGTPVVHAQQLPAPQGPGG